MTVHHEVETADLVEGHRRQRLAPVEGPVYAFPPLFCARPDGHEAPIELRAPAYAAPYLPQRHRPHASIDPPNCPGDFPDLVEEQQLTRSAIASPQACAGLPEQGLPAGQAEVSVHPLFQVHVADHRSPLLCVSGTRTSSGRTSDPQERSVTPPGAGSLWRERYRESEQSGIGRKVDQGGGDASPVGTPPATT